MAGIGTPEVRRDVYVWLHLDDDEPDWGCSLSVRATWQEAHTGIIDALSDSGLSDATMERMANGITAELRRLDADPETVGSAPRIIRGDGEMFILARRRAWNGKTPPEPAKRGLSRGEGGVCVHRPHGYFCAAVEGARMRAHLRLLIVICGAPAADAGRRPGRRSATAPRGR